VHASGLRDSVVQGRTGREKDRCKDASMKGLPASTRRKGRMKQSRCKRDARASTVQLLVRANCQGLKHTRGEGGKKEKHGSGLVVVLKS